MRSTFKNVVGHEDINMTFDVYGHLIRRKETEHMDDEGCVLRNVSASACGESVATVI